MPIYWLFMAIAAVKAFYQLVADRSFWEKTVHGLAESDGAAGELHRADIDLNDVGGEGEPVVGVVRTAVAPLALVTPVALDRNEPVALQWIDTEPHADAHVPRARARRRAGRVLAVAGALLAMFAVYVSVLSGPFTRPVSGRIVSSVPTAPTAGTCIARLTVARVGLVSTICEGTATDVVAHRIGHVSGTALPGQAGEAVVVAHRDAFGGVGSAIAKLRGGDTVVVDIAGASIDYRVVSRSTESRQSVSLGGNSHAGLMLVTGTSGIDPRRVVVVRAAAVSLLHVHFSGPTAQARGNAHLPGGDGGELLLGTGCLVFAGIAVATRKRFAGLAIEPWASGVFAAIAIASVFAAIVIATRALPPTF